MKIIRFPKLKQLTENYLNQIELEKRIKNMNDRITALEKIHDELKEGVPTLISVGKQVQNLTRIALSIEKNLFDEQTLDSEIQLPSFGTYYCESPDCPGYAFKASETAHPTTTCIPPKSMHDKKE